MWGMIAGQLMQGVLNMYGAHQQGKQNASMYAFQARQDEENARAASLETSLAEDQLRKQNRKQLGELEARLAENGLSGSTFDRVFSDSASNLEQDALNLRYEGLSRWRNYKNSAAMNRYGVTMSKVNARQAVWQAGLNSAVGAMGSYAMYNSMKTPQPMTQAEHAQFQEDLNQIAHQYHSPFKATGYGAGNKLSLL